MAIIIKDEVIDTSTYQINVDIKSVSYSSVVNAVRKDGTPVKKSPYRLFINNQEIEMNDNIVALINNLITKI